MPSRVEMTIVDKADKDVIFVLIKLINIFVLSADPIELFSIKSETNRKFTNQADKAKTNTAVKIATIQLTRLIKTFLSAFKTFIRVLYQ